MCTSTRIHTRIKRTQVLFNKKTEQIVGVHIIGLHAADLIQECANAMMAGTTVRQLAMMVRTMYWMCWVCMCGSIYYVMYTLCALYVEYMLYMLFFVFLHLWWVRCSPTWSGRVKSSLTRMHAPNSLLV